MRARHGWAAIGTVLLVGLTAAVAAAQQGGDPQRGGTLFVQNCAICHGVDGKGRVGADLNAFPGIAVGAELTQTITQGVKGSVMPAWGQANGGPLTDQDIADIVAYVTTAFAGTAPIAPLPTYQPPPVTPMPGIAGDPTAGATVYLANCAVCHGDRGQGRIGRTLAKSWPGNDPLAYVRQVVSDGVPGATMPAWAKAHGGPLSAVDIANVAAYVLTLSPAASAPTPPPAPAGPLGRTSSLVLFGLLGVAIVVGLILYYRRA